MSTSQAFPSTTPFQALLPTINQNSIGRFSRTPLHVMRSGISTTARVLWEELALVSSEDRPVWIRQSDIAKKVGCCIRTLRKAINELIAHGLIKQIGWKEGRLKRYALAWLKKFDQEVQNLPTSSATNALGPRTSAAEDVGTICTSIIKVFDQNIEQTNLLGVGAERAEVKLDDSEEVENQRDSACCEEHDSQDLQNVQDRQGRDEPEARPEDQSLVATPGQVTKAPAPGVVGISRMDRVEEIVARSIEAWRQKFKCLDGQSERPSIEDSIAEALSHESSKKHSNVQIFLEGWLRRAARGWWDSFNREQKQKASPELPLNGRNEDQKKRREDANRWVWNNKGRLGGDAELNGRYVPEIRALIDVGDMDGLNRLFYRYETWREGLRAKRVA